ISSGALTYKRVLRQKSGGKLSTIRPVQKIMKRSLDPFKGRLRPLTRIGLRPRRSNRVLPLITHELNTTLTLMQGTTRAMLDNLIPQTDTKHLRALHDNVELMTYLIGDLYTYWELDSGKLVYNKTATDIHAYLESYY